MTDKFVRGFKIDWSKIEENSYLRKINSLASTNHLDFDKAITFFVGENGSGKSTLLEALAVACGFNPEGGTKNFNFHTKETHSKLYNAVTMIKGSKQPRNGFFLRAESFYNVASKVDEYSQGEEAYYIGYGGKSLHEQSHGESFLALMQSKFSAGGLYFLDEPEAALSPQRQLTLLIHLSELAAKGAQFIVATHSPIILGVPEAEILSFQNGKIHSISYEETESYQVMEMFINSRENLLKNLLDI